MLSKFFTSPPAPVALWRMAPAAGRGAGAARATSSHGVGTCCVLGVPWEGRCGTLPSGTCVHTPGWETQSSPAPRARRGKLNGQEAVNSLSNPLPRVPTARLYQAEPRRKGNSIRVQGSESQILLGTMGALEGRHSPLWPLHIPRPRASAQETHTGLVSIPRPPGTAMATGMVPPAAFSPCSMH